MFTYLTDSAYTLIGEGWVLEAPSWVPGVHHKVPLMIGGAMPLLNPRSSTGHRSTILNFSGKANTSIHGLEEGDTATKGGYPPL